jgi:hypothetical protein
MIIMNNVKRSFTNLRTHDQRWDHQGKTPVVPATNGASK